jgi:transposase
VGWPIRACLMWVGGDLPGIVPVMAERLGRESVLDGLWELVEPLIPPQRERPQGGGTRYVEDRAVITAIVYVLSTGCAWRHVPAGFGVSQATAHRHFVAWTEIGGGSPPAARNGLIADRRPDQLQTFDRSSV